MGEPPYQDLVDAGGLEAVLRVACPGCDIDMRDAPGAFGGFVATVSKGERAVYVVPLWDRRLFRVRHKLRGTYLSWLATTSLAEVTGSAATWLGGATARVVVLDVIPADPGGVPGARSVGAVGRRWAVHGCHGSTCGTRRNVRRR